MVMALFSQKNNDSGASANESSSPMIDVEVLELLASRICHDIISPVGAINNGVEFLEEMGAGGSDEAVSLLSHSAKTASAKLMAFRLAYGAGGRDYNIKPEDIHKCFAGLIESDGKITQDWNPHMDFGFEERPEGFCKILMGGLMLAQECLPKGGQVSIETDGKGEVLIHAKSEETLLRPQVEDAMAQTISPEELDPRLVHPYVVGILARHYGFDLKIKQNNKDCITYSLKVMS